jgi:putative OPT family oligopeptide transporter
MVGGTMSLGLVAVGHLIGLTAGIAIGLGMVLSNFVLLPWLSSGVSGPIDEVAGAVFSQQVRFVGAGAIAIAAVWTLLRISGSIIAGLAGIAATARARRDGEVVDITERDMPGWIVGGGIALSAVPIAILLWLFLAGGSLAGSFVTILLMTLLFVAVIGVIVSAVTGYMAGLVGTSNSPVSGVGILSILVAAVAVALIFGNGMDDAERQGLIALALFMTAFVFGIGIVANDNLQDLKTGQLVGSTPWKQQVALCIGVVAGSLVVPPVLNLLLGAFNFAGAPGAGPNALAAPQASLIASIAQGVLSANLRWDLLGLGAGIGAVVIVIDEILVRTGRGKLPPLAVAMGMYLPITLNLPTVIGGFIGYFWNRMAARTKNPEHAERAGVLLATGLIVGDSLFGLVFAGTVAGVGDAERLALLPASFEPASQVVAVALAVGLVVWVYRRTRRTMLATLPG